MTPITCIRELPMVRTTLVALAICGLIREPAVGLAQTVPGTLVMATGQDPALPLPFIGTSSLGNADVADQLFLRLGIFGNTFRTGGDRALTPQLARAWRREDPRTLVFELDSRARWHDGVPVTSRDIVFTWEIARNPRINPDQTAIELIESVTAIDRATVRVRFRRPSSEQLYLFGFAMQPLPAHLLERMPAESIATSDYARAPVGNGPYRWERRVPGQFVELRADSTFFLGRPGIRRLVIRVAADPGARLNLMLSGQVDVLDNLPPPMLAQLGARPEIETVTVTSNTIFYMLFNARQPSDTSRAHPVLADQRVRQALTLALDREAMVRSALGSTAEVPDAVISQLWQWARPLPTGRRNGDVARARTLLAAAGWRDSDGDGVVDRNGTPLRLTMILPSTSAARAAFAVQAEAMWRAVGVAVVLERSDFPAYLARRGSGDWDLDLTAVNQDASPRSLATSWSCASARQPGSSNVARWCDPVFDSLRAAAAEMTGDPTAAWQRAFLRMKEVAPAIFLAAPTNQVAVHRRFANVQILPLRSWLNVWRWRVRPEAALPRDR
ncbi:MAG: peptide ABC transporter substrate-binding protein [Gemmatimonadales bacterium]|nr:peptide ABC transporter substrate-binding protein [Gemmatimonadales bacterium]MDZ4389156.1 peptide ABC transporter substrate-binding protein [Gemmatimonadales bacterium]